jgi:hypothetical protein
MNPFVDPIDAANVLAAAATQVVDRWAAGDLAGAVRGLSDALQYFENARSNDPEAPGREAVSEAFLEPPSSKPPRRPPRRFSAALEMIDTRAQNVPGIAHGIIAACVEVVAEHGMLTKDPAVRLLASQVAWICEIDIDNDVFAALLNECHRRSKDQAAGPSQSEASGG